VRLDHDGVNVRAEELRDGEVPGANDVRDAGAVSR
jgi:hypothetical protein